MTLYINFPENVLPCSRYLIRVTWGYFCFPVELRELCFVFVILACIILCHLSNYLPKPFCPSILAKKLPLRLVTCSPWTAALFQRTLLLPGPVFDLTVWSSRPFYKLSQIPYISCFLYHHHWVDCIFQQLVKKGSMREILIVGLNVAFLGKKSFSP